jgi:hypothetical protein
VYFKLPNKSVILKTCDFIDLSCFNLPNQLCFTPNKSVILSEAPRRSIAKKRLSGAESKDLEGNYLAHAALSFSTTKPVLADPRHGLDTRIPTHENSPVTTVSNAGETRLGLAD